MWIRQELLYYTKGDAYFDVKAEYTEIPKVLKGYYKTVKGEVTENSARSKSENVPPEMSGSDVRADSIVSKKMYRDVMRRSL